MSQAGRYRFVRRLGQGGMAEVLEGVAEGEGGFRRRVAIKRILPDLANDPGVARMFLDEARTASQIHHANVVSVLDYGVVDGVPFQVLELVDGLDLERVMRLANERRIAVPTGLCLFIAVQIAHALQAAHQACDEQGAPLGVVHRDVSCSNVLVSWEGHVKLGDFGIALAHNRLERTQGTGVKGKLEYMAPEQFTRGQVDRRADVFALGCLVHRLVAGSSPLADWSVLTQLALGTELALDPGLPPDLASVLRKALQSVPALRFSSAAELGQTLGELVPRYLPEEPTGALQRFMEALREAAVPAPRLGALDALLNVEMVLAGGSEATEGRSFHVQPEAPELPAVEAVRQDEAPPRPRSRWPVVLLVALLLGAGFGAWQLAARAPALPTPSTEPSARVPVAPAPASEAPKAPQPIPERAAQAHLPPSARHAKKSAAVTPSLPPPVKTMIESKARGTLVIGGPGAQRAEIRIDGESQGFAPKRLELGVGEHEILLLRNDGTKAGPFSVHVAETHTQSSPARLMVP